MGKTVLGIAIIALGLTAFCEDWTGRNGKPSGLTRKGDVFEIKNSEFYVFSTKSHPVGKGVKFRVRGYFRKTADAKETVPLYIGLAYFDKNGTWVDGMKCLPVKNSLTELAAPVRAGDRVLTVKDASAWKHQGSVIAFNAKPDQSDLPNHEISTVVTNVEKTPDGWEISLRRPLAKAYPAGTAVRQHSGAPYQYAIGGYRLTPEWFSLKPFAIVPWQGVSSAKIVIFANIGKPSSLEMKNVALEEIK